MLFLSLFLHRFHLVGYPPIQVFKGFGKQSAVLLLTRQRIETRQNGSNLHRHILVSGHVRPPTETAVGVLQLG